MSNQETAPSDESAETSFVRALATMVLEADDMPNPLAGHDPTQAVIIGPAEQPAFLAYIRAQAAMLHQVDSLAQSLPEDVRSGARPLLHILAGLGKQSAYVAGRVFDKADPVLCPDGTTVNDFAAALLIFARHTNMTITGNYWGTPLIASPVMSVSHITDAFFENLNQPE